MSENTTGSSAATAGRGLRRCAGIAAQGLLIGAVLAACSSGSSKTATTLAPAPTSAAPSTTPPTTALSGIVVQVGISDHPDTTVAVLQFMPASVNVDVGTTVNWTWDGTVEPHSVTFTPPNRKLPRPGSDPTLFMPTPPTAPYDGTSFVNSGLQPLGPGGAKPFSMTFAKAGTYQYHCVIHPNMTGTVVVGPVKTGSFDTPDTVSTRKAAEQAKWLAEGQAAKQKLMSTPATSTKTAKGTLWKVTMGASTPHTDVLAFAPVPVNVKAGDQVEFVNNSGAPHTASFFGQTPPIMNPTDPRTDKPAPGPSPQTLNATDFFNSGLLPPNAPPGAGPPLAARSFTFVVPAAGTYAFVCILHVPSGMAGSIVAS